MSKSSAKVVDPEDAIEILLHNQQMIVDLLEEMRDVIKQFENPEIAERADRNWIAHIKMSLAKDHEYLSGVSVTLDDTIEEINALSNS